MRFSPAALQIHRVAQSAAGGEAGPFLGRKMAPVVSDKTKWETKHNKKQISSQKGDSDNQRL